MDEVLRAFAISDIQCSPVGDERSSVCQLCQKQHFLLDVGLKFETNNTNNNNCLKSNIQCIGLRVQWTVHLKEQRCR